MNERDTEVEKAAREMGDLSWQYFTDKTVRPTTLWRLLTVRTWKGRQVPMSEWFDDETKAQERLAHHAANDWVEIVGLDRYEMSAELAALRQQLAEKDKQLSKPRCDHCGSDKLWDGPPECPRCGAPQCCETCCRLASAMMAPPVVTVQLITTENHRLFNAEVVSQDGGELTGMYVNLNTETLPESAKPGDRLRVERKRDEVWNAFMVWKPFGGPLRENNS